MAKKKKRDEPEESGMTLSSVYHRLVVEPVLKTIFGLVPSFNSKLTY